MPGDCGRNSLFWWWTNGKRRLCKSKKKKIFTYPAPANEERRLCLKVGLNSWFVFCSSPPSIYTKQGWTLCIYDLAQPQWNRLFIQVSSYEHPFFFFFVKYFAVKKWRGVTSQELESKASSFVVCATTQRAFRFKLNFRLYSSYNENTSSRGFRSVDRACTMSSCPFFSPNAHLFSFLFLLLSLKQHGRDNKCMQSFPSNFKKPWPFPQ